MPGWDVHSRIYDLLGLDGRVCRIIDEIVDSEPPSYKEINPEWPDEKAHRHIGFSKNEFSFMYNYIVKNYGVRGGKCLIAHFILDKIEDDLINGYDNEMIANDIKQFLETYMKECKIIQDKCLNIDETLGFIKNSIDKNLDKIITIVKEWLENRITSLDVLVKASSDIVNKIVKVNLYLKGYKGKHGFTTKKGLANAIGFLAKKILRRKLYDTIVEGKLNPNNALVSINNIKKMSRVNNVRTINEYFKIIKQEAELSKDFKVLLDKIYESVDEAIKQYKL